MCSSATNFSSSRNVWTLDRGSTAHQGLVIELLVVRCGLNSQRAFTDARENGPPVGAQRRCTLTIVGWIGLSPMLVALFIPNRCRDSNGRRIFRRRCPHSVASLQTVIDHLCTERLHTLCCRIRIPGLMLTAHTSSLRVKPAQPPARSQAHSPEGSRPSSPSASAKWGVHTLHIEIMIECCAYCAYCFACFACWSHQAIYLL
jgi:hypothetical protein